MGSLRRSLLFLLPLAGFLLGAAAAPEKRPPLGDLDFTLHVVRREPGAKSARAAAVTMDKSVLKTETITVGRGSKVEDLLRSRAIDPDGESLSAVYLLNPDLRDVHAMTPGSRLVLPAIPRKEIGSKALVQMTLVPEIKRDLESATRIIEAPAQLAGTPAELKETTAALRTIRSYLGDLLALVEAREMPVSPEMLRQSLDGARVVREVLERVSRSDGRWSAADRQALVRVSQDMALKAQSLAEIRGPGRSPMRWRDVQVVVAVVQLPGQKPVSDLRVFYAPEALLDKPFAARPFPGLSPQVAKRLIEADYVFWAALPGSSRPVTEQLRQKVRQAQGGEIKLALAALPPAQESR